MVLVGLKTASIPRGAQTFSIFSLRHKVGSPPLPVVGDHLFQLGTFPINVVVILLYMYSNAIPVIISPYSLSVLTESGL